MSKSVIRYADTGATIYGQLQEILVVCPRCRACAHVTVRLGAAPSLPGYFTDRRVICAACGYVKEWNKRGIGFNWNASLMRDCYFGLPLWLQTRCCGHVLWAYNRQHLHIIEQYIAAHLREHRADAKAGWRNSSLVNRLPEWMIVARHRQAVLHAIAKLKG